MSFWVTFGPAGRLVVGPAVGGWARSIFRNYILGRVKCVLGRVKCVQRPPRRSQRVPSTPKHPQVRPKTATNTQKYQKTVKNDQKSPKHPKRARFATFGTPKKTKGPATLISDFGGEIGQILKRSI